MELWECGTKSWKEAVVRPVEGRDFRYLTSREFAFPWKKWKDRADLYKLCLLDEERILGLMALEDIPGDKRIEIKLLASSKENRGAHKKLEGISGCLIAWACRLAPSPTSTGRVACGMPSRSHSAATPSASAALSGRSR